MKIKRNRLKKVGFIEKFTVQAKNSAVETQPSDGSPWRTSNAYLVRENRRFSGPSFAIADFIRQDAAKTAEHCRDAVTAISNFLHRDLVRTKVDLIIASYFFGCIRSCIVRNARKASEFAEGCAVAARLDVVKFANLLRREADVTAEHCRGAVTAISNFLHRDLVRTKVDLIIASYFFGCIRSCIVRNARKAAEFAEGCTVAARLDVVKFANLLRREADVTAEHCRGAVTAISNFLHRDLVRTKVDLIIASYFFGCISGCIVRNARKAAEFAKKDSVSIGQSIAKLAILVKINAMKFCQRFKSFIAAAADYIVASVAKVASFAATSGEKTARQFGAVTAKVSDFTQRKAAEAVKRFRVALAKAGKIFSRDWVRTGADMVVVANFFRHLCSSFAQNVKKMPIFLKNHLKNNAPGAGKFQLRKIFHSAAVEIRKNFSRACRESKQLLRRIASFLLRYIAAVRRDLAAFRNFINGKIWLPAAWLLKLVWPALKFLLYIPAKLDCHFNALGNRMEEKLMNFFSNAGQRTALGLQRAYSAATRPAMAFGVIFAASLFIGLRVYDSQMLKIECGRAELDVKKSRELLINRDKPKQMIGYITQNAVPKQHTRIERASSVRAAKDVDEFRQAVDAFFSEHRVSEIIYMNGACRMKIDDRVVNDLNSLGRGRSGVEMFIADSDGEIITFADSYGNRYAKQIASLFN